MAVGNSSDSSSGSVVKYVQSAWNSHEDRIALAGLGFAAIAAFWASSNLVVAVDKLPVIPGVLEFIGILLSWILLDGEILLHITDEGLEDEDYC